MGMTPSGLGDGRAALDRAIEEYLVYLHVERGLAPATIGAYRGDLRDFAGHAGAAAWDSSADPALQYLQERSAGRAAGSSTGPLRPASLRRRAAAIRSFYRFAYGEGLIEFDVASHLDLPRQPRPLPETLTIEETERLLEAAGGDDDEPRRIRDRALVELLYAAGLRISEALRLDRDEISLEGGFAA
jgi:integrase/recombinase XerD